MKCTITKYPIASSDAVYIPYGGSLEESRFFTRYRYAILDPEELDIIDSLLEDLEPDEYLEVAP